MLIVYSLAVDELVRLLGCSQINIFTATVGKGTAFSVAFSVYAEFSEINMRRGRQMFELIVLFAESALNSRKFEILWCLLQRLDLKYAEIETCSS